MPRGGIFTDQARAGLAEYHDFRRRHPGMRRADLSALWQVEKARLQQQKNDPRYLNSRLLTLSQSRPYCYPYGLAPQDLRDAPKLRAALVRALLSE